MSKSVNDYFARLTMIPVSTKPWPECVIPTAQDRAELDQMQADYIAALRDQPIPGTPAPFNPNAPRVDTGE